MYGLLVGDALGVPYEFHDASEIPQQSTKSKWNLRSDFDRLTWASQSGT
ncbi:hypothetical protein [Paraburkholderia sp. Clong3]